MFEQADAGSDPLSGLLSPGLGEVAHGVQGKGQEVEHDQHAGQVLLAMAEVAFQVVPLALEDIEGLILDFPPALGALGEFPDLVAGHLEVDDVGAAAGDRAVWTLNGDRQPVHPQGIFAIAEGGIRHPLVSNHAPLRPPSP